MSAMPNNGSSPPLPVLKQGQTQGIMVPDKQRALLLTCRQVLIMLLGALEDYLDMERSIIPKHKRV